jgi:hypothetical protein
MKTSEDHKKQMAKALEFKEEYPEEKQTAAARIYKANENTVRTNRYRARLRNGKPPPGGGGHNKTPSEAQIRAVYKYVEDSYLGDYGATRTMVWKAIGYIKSSEIPSKKQPSWRWFQTFMASHPSLFRVLKTKPIA